MVYKKKKKFDATRNCQRKLPRLLFWFALVAFFGVVIYVLFFSPFLAVTIFKVDGNKNVLESDILNQIKPNMVGKFLGVVNKNNLLLVRKSKIRKNILESSRQIRSVDVRKKFPTELDVRIIERVPTLLFRSTNSWFMLDENAVAYDTTDPEGTEFNKYGLTSLSDIDGKDINLGDTVLDNDYMHYILDIQKKMQSDTEVEIESSFETPTLISKDIRVKTREGWGIYFNENIALDKEIEMLNIVLEHEIDKNQRPDLEYIDLRIDNKVYYKFREGTPEETARLAAEEAAQNPASADNPTDGTENKKKK